MCIVPLSSNNSRHFLSGWQYLPPPMKSQWSWSLWNIYIVCKEHCANWKAKFESNMFFWSGHHSFKLYFFPQNNIFHWKYKIHENNNFKILSKPLQIKYAKLFFRQIYILFALGFYVSASKKSHNFLDLIEKLCSNK